MSGHAPEATLRAVREQSARGITTMLPTEDALWVADELTRRFGVTRWQFALTATDANRFSIRLARHVTGRPKVLVFNWCYHGTVDEAFATLESGRVVARKGNLGPPVPPAETTKVVEWNDLAALEAALAPRDVALVLTEPALTNVGIVASRAGLPRRASCAHARHRNAARDRRDPHDLLRPRRLHRRARARARRRHGRQAHRRRRPGVGVRVHRRAGRQDRDVDRARGRRRRRRRRDARRERPVPRRDAGHARGGADRGGVRADDPARGAVDGRRGRRDRRVGASLARHQARLPRRVPVRAGATAERHGRARGGRLRARAYMHLHALNRGILLTPFHNMALMSPATTEADVDRHTEVFREAVGALLKLTRSGAKRPQIAAIARDGPCARRGPPLDSPHLSRRAFGFAGSVSFCAVLSVALRRAPTVRAGDRAPSRSPPSRPPSSRQSRGRAAGTSPGRGARSCSSRRSRSRLWRSSRPESRSGRGSWSWSARSWGSRLAAGLRAWAVAPDATVLEAERTLVYAGAAAAAFLAVTRDRAEELVARRTRRRGRGDARRARRARARLGDSRATGSSCPSATANAAGILAATTLLLGLGLVVRCAGWRRGLGCCALPARGRGALPLALARLPRRGRARARRARW